MNPFKNKTILEQKQIAEKQRKEQELREQAKLQSIEKKKQWMHSDLEYLKQQKLKESKKQEELHKLKFFQEEKKGKEDE